MTKAQIRLYWREWNKVRKAAPETDRHELHSKALGYDASHKEFTNGDLDKVLAEAIAHDGPTLVDVVVQPLEEAAAPVRRWMG